MPGKFEVVDKVELLGFISRWNFGDLITSHNGQLRVSHAPFLVDEQEMALYCHFGRHAAHIKDIIAAKELLILFKGPHAYVSPRWYEQKDMVPTWNFQSVTVKGRAQAVGPAEVVMILDRLTQKHEALYENPWRIEDVSEEALKTMLREIIGFKIPIDVLCGQYKLSQNRSIDIQEMVIGGLLAGGSDMEREVVASMRQNQTRQEKESRVRGARSDKGINP